MSSIEQQQAFLGGLIEAARRETDHRLQIRDGSGAIVATVQAHDLPTRPSDMPRHLRPKQKLSKRARDAAKRTKLGRTA